MDRVKLILIFVGCCLLIVISSPIVFGVESEYATAKELKLMEGFPPPPGKRVNTSNALMTPPFNRWSYLNMRKLYPSANVAAADKPYKLKKSIDKGLASIRIPKPSDEGKVNGKYIPTDKTVDLNTYLKETYTDAFVVIKGNKIVYKAFFNGMNPNHPHQMMSVTKSFTGLFGLMATADGKLKESDLVVKYVPELKSSGAFRDATFGQVLNMTNSMEFSEKYSDPNSDIVQYGAVIGLMKPKPGKKYAKNIYDYLVSLRKDPKYKHGEIFHYQTPKTDVVNWVTNRVTGKSFEDNLYEILWSKIGAEGETYVLLDKNATLFAGGGLNASPYNLARFASMMLNGGKLNGKQVVPTSVIEQIAEGASQEAFSKGSEAHGIMKNGDWSYRAQWWVRHTPGKKAFTAIGIHGQWIYINPEKKIAIIKQSSQPTSATDYLTAYDILGFDSIIAYLSNTRTKEGL